MQPRVWRPEGYVSEATVTRIMQLVDNYAAYKVAAARTALQGTTTTTGEHTGVTRKARLQIENAIRSLLAKG